MTHIPDVRGGVALVYTQHIMSMMTMHIPSMNEGRWWHNAAHRALPSMMTPNSF